MVKLRAGILLDRDGTIIEDWHYVHRPEQVRFIEGAPEAIASFNAAGIPVAVITNQGGVAFGYYTVDDVESTHDYIAAELAKYDAHVDLFVYCPYHPNGTVRPFARSSLDRKPSPGMAYAVDDALRLDLTRSWVVGDRPEDMRLALAIEANGIRVGPHEYEPIEHPAFPKHPAFPSLAEAAPYILERIDRD